MNFLFLSIRLVRQSYEGHGKPQRDEQTSLVWPYRARLHRTRSGKCDRRTGVEMHRRSDCNDSSNPVCAACRPTCFAALLLFLIGRRLISIDCQQPQHSLELPMKLTPNFPHRTLARAIVCALVALVPLAARSQDAPKRDAHGIAVANMDPSVKPGDDFYRYANGDWIKRTEIPPDRGRI